MSYLTEEAIEQLSNEVDLRPYSQHYRVHDFDCGLEEYNEFISTHAGKFDECGVSKTQLLLNKKNADVIGYITLCADSIKLKSDEKEKHRMGDVPFKAIPALKIAKLAVDKKYRGTRKGYGSFLILLARGIADQLNDQGVGCRFITVDADIEYDPSTVDFCIRNGFTYNESYKAKGPTRSMRLDIFNIEEAALELTGTEDE